MDWKGVLTTTWGAAQASISVLLIMTYGYVSRAYELLTQQGEQNISKVSTTLFLPALLFSEIGPEASASRLVRYWPIIVFALLTQLISFLYAYLGRRIFGSARIPQWIVPACIFPNVISLPLLMLESLGKTGALDNIITGAGDADGALRRARNYLLVNALVYNLTRFGFGPKLMPEAKPKSDSQTASDSAPQSPVDSLSPDGEHSESERTPLLPTSRAQASSRLRIIWGYVKGAINPPLVGGFLAIFVGIIPQLHSVFLDKHGALKGSLTQSIEKMGDLYTAIQMLVVGAHLYSSSKRSKQTKLPKLAMVYLFALRFVLMPVFSISFIYAIRQWKPDLLIKDPMFDFALMIAPIGPPAITLAAVAELANLSEEESGVISRMLTLSYMITPLISLPITAALAVVQQEGLTYTS